MQRYTVDGNELPTYRAVLLGVLFHPRWRVYHKNARGPVKAADHVSISLLHVKVQESPPICDTFRFGPLTFDFVFCPDFGSILVR